MNCLDVIGRLSDYIEGELGFRQTSEIDNHLSGCHRCAVNLATLRLTMDLARKAGMRTDHGNASILRKLQIRLRRMINNYHYES